MSASTITTPIENLVEHLCSRVIYSGLTSTVLEASSESLAAQAVNMLALHHQEADYRFNKKRCEWHVVAYH